MAAISSKSPGKVTIRRVKLERSYERYLWLFMRLSGVAMLILAVGHMVIQHVLNSSANLTLQFVAAQWSSCLLYTSPSPRDRTRSRMPSSA